MIRSSSPGILDNDTYHLYINVNQNCSLNLQTQSYQRIFRMENGASQKMIIHLAPNSHFCFIPHPMVPHEDSIFQSRTIVNMSENSSLIYGEIITCGRKLSGEEFKFTSLRNILEIYRQDRLIFKDHLFLCPKTTSLKKIGLFENFTHQANLIFLPGEFTAVLIDDLHEYFLKNGSVTAGITEVASKGILIRLLGNSGEQLFTILQEISAHLRKTWVSQPFSLIFQDK